MSRIRIALSELEASDADLFRASLARLVTRLPQHWEWADLAHADLVIVDMDSLFGHMAWLKAHGAGKQVITFARSGAVHGSDLVLGKPLNDEAFARVLDQAARKFDMGDAMLQVDEETAEMPAAPIPVPVAQPRATAAPEHVPATVRTTHEMNMYAAGDAPPPPLPPTAEPAEPQVEPEPDPANVADVLVRRPPSGARRVVGTDLIVDPERDAYYAADAALKPLKAALEHEPSALQILEAGTLATARQSKAHPLARLRWFAGLVATPGVLAWGLRDDQRYKLSRWPQTEREFPRHFRIATAMMKEAATPADLANASGVPLPEVIDYINASRAAGWLEVQRDEPPPAEEDGSQRGNVLSRFRKPFGR